MEDTSKQITGRTVLMWLIGFFLVVFAVNGVMGLGCARQLERPVHR